MCCSNNISNVADNLWTRLTDNCSWVQIKLQHYKSSLRQIKPTHRRTNTLYRELWAAFLCCFGNRLYSQNTPTTHTHTHSHTHGQTYFSFWRLLFTRKASLSAQAPSSEIWLSLRLQNVRKEEMRGGSTNLFTLCKVYLVSLPHYWDTVSDTLCHFLRKIEDYSLCG